MKLRSYGLNPNLKDSPLLNALFDRTFLTAVLALFPSVYFPIRAHDRFHQQVLGIRPWAMKDLIPAYGCTVAILWLFLAWRWAKTEEERLGKIPEQSVEQAYRHAELEGQRQGIRGVLWGTMIGSWVVMVAGWELTDFLS